MSSWGSGESTSEAEAKAAASTGVPTRELPVSYSLPPDLLSAWQHSANRPGMSLVGADLRPDLMVNNVRSTVFPHLQQKVQSSIALSLSRQAWGEVESLERVHEWKCGNVAPVLKMVQPVLEEGQELRSNHQPGRFQPAEHAPTSKGEVQMPPITKTEEFLGKLWSGQLWKGIAARNPFSAEARQKSSAEAAAAAASSFPTAPASPSSSSTNPFPHSTFVLSTGPAPDRFLSSERWLVQRCDGHQLYRVQYFGNGDLFYAQVVPTDLKGLLTSTYVSFKQHFRHGL